MCGLDLRAKQLLLLTLPLCLIACGGGGGGKSSSRKDFIKPKPVPPPPKPTFIVTLTQKSIEPCSGSLTPNVPSLTIPKGESRILTLTPDPSCKAILFEDDRIMSQAANAHTYKLDNISKNKSIRIIWVTSKETQGWDPKPNPALQPTCVENGLQCVPKNNFDIGVRPKDVHYPNLICPLNHRCVLRHRDIEVNIKLFLDPNCTGSHTELSTESDDRNALPNPNIRMSSSTRSVCVRISKKGFAPFDESFISPIQIIFYGHRDGIGSQNTTSGPKDPTFYPILHTIESDEFVQTKPDRFTWQSPPDFQFTPNSLKAIGFRTPDAGSINNGFVAWGFFCTDAEAFNCKLVFRTTSSLGPELNRKIKFIHLSKFTNIHEFESPRFEGSATCLKSGTHRKGPDDKPFRTSSVYVYPHLDDCPDVPPGSEPTSDDPTVQELIALVKELKADLIEATERHIRHNDEDILKMIERTNEHREILGELLSENDPEHSEFLSIIKQLEIRKSELDEKREELHKRLRRYRDIIVKDTKAELKEQVKELKEELRSILLPEYYSVKEKIAALDVQIAALRKAIAEEDDPEVKAALQKKLEELLKRREYYVKLLKEIEAKLIKYFGKNFERPDLKLPDLSDPGSAVDVLKKLEASLIKQRDVVFQNYIDTAKKEIADTKADIKSIQSTIRYLERKKRKISKSKIKKFLKRKKLRKIKRKLKIKYAELKALQERLKRLEEKKRKLEDGQKLIDNQIKIVSSRIEQLSKLPQ